MMDIKADSSGLSRQYVKLCEREDFDDPAFQARVSEIVPGLSGNERLHRKYWEFAMLALYLEEVDALREDANALAIAAGNEHTLYWMANRVGRVVATDIYGKGAFGDREADAKMLANPATYAPFPYREDHLEVRYMDALAPDLPEASFDIVYCVSSIEHFGGLRSAAHAVRGMARLLRPGGHLVITTECLVGRHPLDWPPLQFTIRLATLGRRCGAATLRSRATETFTPCELQRYVVEASGLELVQPLKTTVSSESYENLARWNGDSEPVTASGDKFPHIVLQAHGAPWTSVFLALRKAAGEE